MKGDLGGCYSNGLPPSRGEVGCKEIFLSVMIIIKNNNIKDKNLKAELAFLKAVPPFSDLNDHEFRFLLENLIKPKLSDFLRRYVLKS